jgi:hypothetical protein
MFRMFEQYARTGFGLEGLAGRLLSAAEEKSKAEADAIADDIRAQMRASTGGRVYKRPGGRIHIASRPGNPPAVDYENLIKSIDVVKTGRASWRVQTDSPYAHRLEFGGGNIEARPVWRPTARKHQASFKSAMLLAIRSAVG